MDDRILFSKIKDGDEAAFVSLLDKYEKRVFRYFQACFHDYHTAQDLTQNVFCALLQQISKSWERWNNFPCYLFKMCKNMAIKERTRKMRFWPLSVDEPVEQADIAPELPLEREELSKLMTQTIGTLPFLQKQTLVLKFVEGFSVKEIAEILEIPVNTVKSHIFRAKESLRKYLVAYDKEGEHDIL